MYEPVLYRGLCQMSAGILPSLLPSTASIEQDITLQTFSVIDNLFRLLDETPGTTLIQINVFISDFRHANLIIELLKRNGVVASELIKSCSVIRFSNKNQLIGLEVTIQFQSLLNSKL